MAVIIIEARDLPDFRKKKYQRPEYHLEKTMTFMFNGIKRKPSKITCRQCSSCHGCR